MEFRFWRRKESQAAPDGSRAPSPSSMPVVETRLPVHILSDDAELRAKNGNLVINSSAANHEVRLDEIAYIALHGGANVSAACLRHLTEAGVPLVLHSRSGYYLGQIADLSGNSASVRRAQYAAAADHDRALAVARSLIAGKIANAARIAQRRLGGGSNAVLRLKKAQTAANASQSAASLRGVEGAAAAVWYDAVSEFLLPNSAGLVFDRRNRRPPADPVNALLSYLYAVITGQASAAALSVGFDPFVGFFHVERAGRPALSLDLAEPYRVAIVDAAVISSLNNGEFQPDAFEKLKDGSVRLTITGRRTALNALERRLSTPLAYDGRETTWRGAMARHINLLAAALRSEGPLPPAPLPKR